MTESLMFSIIEIKPDIAFSITVATCFTKNPSYAYTEIINIIFQYQKGSMNCSITYRDKRKNLSIRGYLDSDWVGDKARCKSTSSLILC